MYEATTAPTTSNFISFHKIPIKWVIWAEIVTAFVNKIRNRIDLSTDR